MFLDRYRAFAGHGVCGINFSTHIGRKFKNRTLSRFTDGFRKKVFVHQHHIMELTHIPSRSSVICNFPPGVVSVSDSLVVSGQRALNPRVEEPDYVTPPCSASVPERQLLPLGLAQFCTSRLMQQVQV